jgi:hypothetical protein
MAVVTVAPAIPVAGGGFRPYSGSADYYCTGVDDQVIINAAIQYVSGAYFGGTVYLLEGTFNTSNTINFASNVVLQGSGSGTIISQLPTGTGYDILSASHLINVSVKTLKIVGSILSTANNIFYTYVTGGIIDNVYILYPTGQAAVRAGINVQNSDSIFIQNCTIDGNLVDYPGPMGIYMVTNTSIKITNNIIKSLRGSAASTNQVIGIFLAGNTGGITVQNNTIYNLAIANGAVAALGAYLIDNYTIFSNNRIEGTKNSVTAGLAAGVYIVGGTSMSIVANYCYNNGTDTGIANTNGKNFDDLGTDTQISSNSWQSPVASEPSMGTWHDVSAPVDAWLLNQVVVGGTWYTVTFPVGAGVGYVPMGTKKVKAYGQLFRTTAAVNSTMYYRIYGSGAGTNRSRALLAVYTALLDDVISAGQIELPIDSQGRVEISCDVAGPTAQISNAFAYSC